jgi:peptidoglycan/xylan/chitin deacetylase (PgdA/CDA1 family)
LRAKSTPNIKEKIAKMIEEGKKPMICLLSRYNIRATFFVPAETARRHPDLVKEIHLQGHEIGHHGDIHENPVDLKIEEERRILATGIETLEKITGKRPLGYRSPSWDLGKNSVQLLREYGFIYDSSMMADDYHLYYVEDKGEPTHLVEVPVSWELDDAPHFLFMFRPVYYAGMSTPSKVL